MLKQLGAQRENLEKKNFYSSRNNNPFRKSIQSPNLSQQRKIILIKPNSY